MSPKPSPSHSPSFSVTPLPLQDHGTSRKGDVVSVSCHGCRPGQNYSRESKISVVPMEDDVSRGPKKRVPKSIPSPNAMFKTIISSLSRKSPAGCHPDRNIVQDADYWKVALGELARKLIETTTERDEALLEASRLKSHLVELEKKLNRLESYCHSLKSHLEEKNISATNDGKVVKHFLAAVARARKCIGILSRLFVLELRSGSIAHETILGFLRPYGVILEDDASPSTDPRVFIFCLDAILNDTFFEDFESAGFHRNSSCPILNPNDLCKANFTSYQALERVMTWQGVVEKGTKHFSDGFGKYCDRKMSEIMRRLGWARAWPEPMLEAFFEAAKSVWAVHLLANSVHPGLMILRVDKGMRFDPGFMEDVGCNGDQIGLVRFRVAPGFFVQGGLVKCTVVCACE